MTVLDQSDKRISINVMTVVIIQLMITSDVSRTAIPKPFGKQNNARIFWGELIDKYKDINANSKTVFTDYAMLKLVLYSPHMFLLFCQSKVGVVKKFFSLWYLRLRKLGPSWYFLLYRCNACWKPAKSKREIYVTNIGH